ncbi:Maf family nucleotide pyrophosphatase [Xanthomonadaceae bacterium JHOS43]|nr:Maf family nucleotide pyrophosphatase [Xanthomonadaceae bacterium JHOS43]MCX7563306.1 Maf family nucleotide pyrophosphatase [Xanthomonadaceae bacterium XH05]
MLYLASKSPRRRQLLEGLGYRFQCLDIDIPEQRAPGESPVRYVSRVAREKAQAGLALLRDTPGAVVLGADTEVVLDDAVFGKPANAADAAAMLRQLSGRTHDVISVVWLVAAGREDVARCRTRVTFTELSDARIDTYLACGEAFGKAGAYAIQGRAATFVSHLSGSHSGVMGLPVYETAALLARFGLQPASCSEPA